MKAKILIVDDDADIVTVLEDRLQASGYTTVIARDGQQALDQIEHEAPNLILLDLDLPKLTGIEVLKRLSQIKHVEDLPVIVMTAHGSVNAAVEAMKEGAYDFLTKPLGTGLVLHGLPRGLAGEAEVKGTWHDCIATW